jgi:hypothetical protein
VLPGLLPGQRIPLELVLPAFSGKLPGQSGSRCARLREALTRRVIYAAQLQRHNTIAAFPFHPPRLVEEGNSRRHLSSFCIQKAPFLGKTPRIKHILVWEVVICTRFHCILPTGSGRERGPRLLVLAFLLPKLNNRRETREGTAPRRLTIDKVETDASRTGKLVIRSSG